MDEAALLEEFKRVSDLLVESRKLKGDWDYDLVAEWMPLYEKAKNIDVMITYETLSKLVLLTMEK